MLSASGSDFLRRQIAKRIQVVDYLGWVLGGRRLQWVRDLLLEQLKAGRVMIVVGIDVGVEGARVEDQHDGVISEDRISSIRSGTSLWSLPDFFIAAPTHR